jgi:hypothetical protein
MLNLGFFCDIQMEVRCMQLDFRREYRTKGADLEIINIIPIKIEIISPVDGDKNCQGIGPRWV